MTSNSNQDKAASVVNAAQAACLKSYANGDFEHMIDCPTAESLKDELDDCGDGLLKFLMIELSDSEDCSNLDDAICRVRTAIGDLESVADALDLARAG